MDGGSSSGGGTATCCAVCTKTLQGRVSVALRGVNAYCGDCSKCHNCRRRIVDAAGCFELLDELFCADCEFEYREKLQSMGGRPSGARSTAQSPSASHVRFCASTSFDCQTVKQAPSEYMFKPLRPLALTKDCERRFADAVSQVNTDLKKQAEGSKTTREKPTSSVRQSNFQLSDEASAYLHKLLGQESKKPDASR